MIFMFFWHFHVFFGGSTRDLKILKLVTFHIIFQGLLHRWWSSSFPQIHGKKSASEGRHGCRIPCFLLGNHLRKLRWQWKVTMITMVTGRYIFKWLFCFSIVMFYFGSVSSYLAGVEKVLVESWFEAFRGGFKVTAILMFGRRLED